MSSLHKLNVNPANLDPNGIVEAQAVVVGTTPNLVLNGALCDAGTALQFDIGDAYSNGVGGVRFLVDSVGDINTNVFTFTGLDQDGNSVIETVTGVTTTAVSTVNYYSKLTSITASIDTISNVFVGTVGGALVTKTIPVNKHSQVGATIAVLGLAGTTQFDLQETFEDMRTVTAPNWVNLTSNASADVATVSTTGATAVRLVMDSYSDGAELQLHTVSNPFR